MKLLDIKHLVLELEANGATDDCEIDFMVCDANDNHEVENISLNITDLDELHGNKTRGEDMSYEIYINLPDDNIVTRLTSSEG